MIEFYPVKKKWRWRVRAKNNKILGASSESFFSKWNAQKNLQSFYLALKKELKKKYD